MSDSYIILYAFEPGHHLAYTDHLLTVSASESSLIH